MKIAVVDDEKIWRNKAVEIIKEYFEEVSISTFASGEGLLDNNEEYAIVILDIEMQGKDGFQTALEYKISYPDAIIIMLTTHIELSRKGYVVDAFRYVDKTKMCEEMEEAFFSAKKVLERFSVVQINVIGIGSIPVVLKDIIYIETKERKVLVHTYDNVYECSESIGNLEKKLSEKGFFRCHKSYIVNLDAIKKIDKVFVYMADGDKVMVGTKKYATLKKAYIKRKCEYANF